MERTIFFRCLFQQDRRAALRTCFLDRFVPINLVAFRIIYTTIEDLSALRFLDRDLAAIFRALYARYHVSFNVIALRIVRTSRKFAEAAVASNKVRSVLRAKFVE